MIEREAGTMKYLAGSLILAGLISLNLYGAPPSQKPEGKGKPGLEEKRHDRLDRLAKKLNLSESQKEKIAAIFKEGDARIRSEMDRIRDKAREIREETDKKIDEVLTPEQRAKFAEMKKKLHDRMEKRGKGHRGERDRYDSESPRQEKGE
jgi:periplasmic protein CpxP/Spy